MTMTNHVVRLYAVALALAVLFLTWAVVAAKPWATTAVEKDPRLVALERREARLRKQSIRVNRVVKRRFARYERQLRARKREIATIEAANAAAAAAASAAPVSSGGSTAVSSAAATAPTAPAVPSVSVVDLPAATSSGSS
jgi:hypothetical protein